MQRITIPTTAQVNGRILNNLLKLKIHDAEVHSLEDVTQNQGSLLMEGTNLELSALLAIMLERAEEDTGGYWKKS